MIGFERVHCGMGQAEMLKCADLLFTHRTTTQKLWCIMYNAMVRSAMFHNNKLQNIWDPDIDETMNCAQIAYVVLCTRNPIYSV